MNIVASLLRQEKAARVTQIKKEEVRTVCMHRWHDSVCRQSCEIHRKCIGTNELVQQGLSIQDQYTEFNCISMY